MSHTISIGVVGARFWSYMAFTMARTLGNVIKNGEKTKVPMDIWRDAQQFFRIVLKEKIDDAVFDKPLAQSNAHCLAWGVLSSCGEFKCETQEEADNYFTKFATLLGELNKDKTMGPLDPEGLKTAEELQTFFTTLYQLGKREDARD